MNKMALALITILYFSGCGISSSDSSANDVILKSDRIDGEAVVVGLPVDRHENTKSGNGRVKQVWRILADDKQEHLKFEVIGDNQKDADLIGWNCEQFDKDGNSISQIAESSFCHSFFIDVLGKFVSNPELVTVGLLNKAKDSKVNAVHEVGDFSFETDGRYYFIRRISRI